VVEEGTRIELKTAASAVATGAHEEYLARVDRKFALAYLGMSDATDPGTHGSNAAVETRAAEVMEPRALMDGRDLCETIRPSLFAWLLRFNGKALGGDPSTFPVPRAAYGADARDDGAAIESSRQSLNGAQIAALLDIAKAVKLGEVASDAADAIINASNFPGIDADRAAKIAGLGKHAPSLPTGVLDAEPDAPPEPAVEVMPDADPVVVTASAKPQKKKTGRRGLAGA
jgi:hypothetical protein